MDKATEQAMDELHGAVAAVLKTQLQATATIIGEDGKPVEMSMVTPAVINAAIKFLKDNDITTTIEVGDDMDDLQEILKKKKHKGRAQLRAVPAKDAAAE